jgi:hypothetical protein
MIASADIEEIQLTATHVEEGPREASDQPRQLRFQIVQTNRSRGIEKRIGVGDDARVYIEDTAVRFRHRFDIALTSLNPEPAKQWRIAFGWGYAAAAFLVLTAIHYLLMGSTLSAYLPYGMVPATILLGVGTVVGFLGLIYHSRYQYCYRTRHGEVELLTLLYGRPNRNRFRDFLSRLSGSIRAAQRDDGFDRKTVLANELREHRYLKDAGVITPESYERAKAKILASH